MRLSRKSETVAEKCDSRRISRLSRRFRRQSHFCATVSLFCDSVDKALHQCIMSMFFLRVGYSCFSRNIVRFSHLLQRLYIRFIRGLLYRPVMLLFRDARPNISIMGSSGTSLARSAVAHGERRSGLLEKIVSGGRSQKTGWLSMSRKVGSRLSCRVLVAVWKCRPGSSFGDFPGGSRVGWRSKAEVEIPIVFPVLLVGTELRPTRRVQYGNCDVCW